MTMYAYRPIDFDRPAIRLLRLLSGKFTDDIRCELFNGWINQSDGGIPYTALSYTWGGTSKTDIITVNNCTMHVTANLYMALRHLRCEDEDLILWIDAICINQDDKKEKNHQVQQMSYIYKEAEQVVIWLGLSTKESDYIMDSIKRLQENSILVEGDWRRSTQLWRYQQAGLESIYMLHKGMKLVLDRPWFRRIWILQEVANARVATILCGTKSVSASIFAQVPALIGLRPPTHCQAVLDIMPGLSRKESWWGQKRDLYTLLHKFRQSEATNERDIIYALRSISSDACRSDILRPDYEKSLQQVIRDTVSFLMPLPNQDSSLYDFLDWTLPTFLQNLDTLKSAIFRSASEHGQETMVKELFATGGVVVNLHNGGLTPLSLAAEKGHESVVKFLLQHDADLEAKGGRDLTPLLLAAENGHESVVKLLLQHDANVGVRDSRGLTPLSLAAENGHESVMKLLLQHDANVGVRDSRGLTPLSFAGEKRHESEVKFVLPRTLLLSAAARGDVAAVKQLVEDGANLEQRDIYGLTPLSWAAKMGHKTVAKLLLKHGASLEARDIKSSTPLSWAAEQGHETVVKLLLEHNANLESMEKWGFTPLSMAAKGGHEAVVKLLLEHGANVEPKAISGLTPLSLAATKRHKTVVKLLLEHRASLKSVDTCKGKPLFGAVREGTKL